MELKTFSSEKGEFVFVLKVHEVELAQAPFTDLEVKRMRAADASATVSDKMQVLADMARRIEAGRGSHHGGTEGTEKRKGKRF